MYEKILSRITDWRRHIHQYPELGNNEFKTANYIEKQLNMIGISSKRITPTGVVACIGNRPGTCVALRADIDALPIQEKNNHAYCSKKDGISHACGHDSHVAMLLGAATLISENQNFDGTVKLIFQPNEEGANGAKQMIQAGVMLCPKVDTVFGLHVNPRLLEDKIGVVAGPLMAAVDNFNLKIYGNGGHAAYPHEGIDVIPVAANIIQLLQNIVSRKINPMKPSVITIGKINAGSNANVLAEVATMEGTVRVLDEFTRKTLKKHIYATIHHVCEMNNMKYTLQYDSVANVLCNSKPEATMVKEIVKDIFEHEVLQNVNLCSMGGEDFSEYLEHAPGCFIYIGIRDPKKPFIPWHHPQFDLNEKSLLNGAVLLSEIARKFLKN